MSECAPYVLDADVFIRAKREYYAFDLAPQFWEELARRAANGQVLSVDKVAGELSRFEDELSRWAANDFSEAFATTDDDSVLEWYRQLMAWAQAHGQYRDAAKREFANGDNADPWIVAYAKAEGCTVVTNEKARPESKKRIPIPNACNAFNVPYCTLFVMMREIGMRV